MEAFSKILTEQDKTSAVLKRRRIAAPVDDGRYSAVMLKI
jgi:hypothetical protein